MVRKKKVKIYHETEIDRLSNLPDSIIHHILSFMDTKFAVQTSVLAKRWNHLWTLLPSLSFDFEYFTTFTSFNNFVLHVLSHRKASNLRSFIFSNRLGFDQSFVDWVICYAVSHHAQQIHIYVPWWSDFVLPQCLFTSQSLRVLKLRSCNFTNLPNSWDFASLTTLHFHAVYLQNCVDLFSSCVNLENLFLTDCVVTSRDAFNISAPQLINLTISHLIINWRGENRKVMVSAPRLTSFNFTNSTPLVFSMHNCPNLGSINAQMYTDINDNIFDLIGDLISMLKEFSNAKSLALSFDTIKVLSEFPRLLENEPSPFKNLKSLKVTARRRIISLVIPLHVMTFLLSSPAVTLAVEFHRPERLRNRWRITE